MKSELLFESWVSDTVLGTIYIWLEAYISHPRGLVVVTLVQSPKAWVTCLVVTATTGQ